MARAMKVNNVTGIPKIIQLRTAVNISSKALAKVFRMEFNFFKKRDVTIPMAALFKMMAMTLIVMIDVILSLVNASLSDPPDFRTIRLQRMESTYM